MAVGGTGLLKWLGLVVGVSFLGMYYVDVIYLPQQQQFDEHSKELNLLAREVHSEHERADLEHDEHGALIARVTALEKLVASMQVAEEASASAMGATAGGTDVAEGAIAGQGKGSGESASAAAEGDKDKHLRQSKGKTQDKEGEAEKAAKESKGKGKDEPEPEKKSKGKEKPDVKVRDDHMCGSRAQVGEWFGAQAGAWAGWLGSWLEVKDGPLIGCNASGLYPCCSSSGWCGSSPNHCSCEGCVDYRNAQSTPQGQYDVKSPKNIAIVIPFRDRAIHMTHFREALQKHIESWNRRGIRHNWVVFVAEQFDKALFNRGYLFNAGFKHSEEYAQTMDMTFDCVVMHDIDMLPDAEVDYGYCRQPNQLSSEIACWGNSVPYPDNTGGVISLSPSHWRQINGFSNDYDGWGGEDDDLYLRLKANKFLNGGCHTFCHTDHKNKPMVYRPALGKGKFRCMNDGDHTPRQRNQEDGPMWSRLNDMKRGSKRWQKDGISNVKVNRAAPPLIAQACEKPCAVPEDPTPRVRDFAELHARVSAKPILDTSRILVQPPGERHECEDVPGSQLDAVPVGFLELRDMASRSVAKTQSSETWRRKACGLAADWGKAANFALVDIALGQAVLMGDGAVVVDADSSLPPLVLGGEGTKSKWKMPAPRAEHDWMQQGQRLGRWIRNLPAEHRGWAVAVSSPLPDLRKRFTGSSRRVQSLVPACICSADYDGGKKYRVQPGTKWCGDGGWTSLEHFMVLRSETQVPADKVFPVCIAYSDKHYVYRFDNSEDGCVGTANGLTWKHVGTIHTSTDARGEKVCVGSINDGAKSRWIMKKASSCSTGGYTHKFSFNAMAPETRAPLKQACLQALPSAAASAPASVRLAAGKSCATSGSWKLELDVVLLNSRRSKEDHRVCLAEGKLDSSESETDKKLLAYRVFHEAICDKKKFVTNDAGVAKIRWELTVPELFIPQDAAGPRVCQCRLSKAQAPPGTPATALYTMMRPSCEGEGVVQEVCFHGLSRQQVIDAVDLLDEVI